MALENIVSVVDFINTYSSIDLAQSDYGLAYLHEKGILANLLGREEYPQIVPSIESISIATRNAHARGRTTPVSVQVIYALETIGITFPITYENNAAELIFQLYGMNLFSGCIFATFQSQFHIKKERIKENNGKISEVRTGLELTRLDGDRYALKREKVSAGVGRILYLMGLPMQGRKISAEIDFSQIDCILNRNKLSNAVINEMLYNRARKHSKPSARFVQLPKRKSRETADLFGRKMVVLLESVFRGLRFRSKSIPEHNKAGRCWGPRVYLSYEKIRAMESYGVLEDATRKVLRED